MEAVLAVRLGTSRRVSGGWAQCCSPMTGDSAISRITKIVWPWLLVLNCWGSLQNWSLGPAVIPTTWLILVVPAFFVLSHLYSSKIYQSLVAVKLGNSSNASKGWGSWSLTLPSLMWETLVREFPLGTEQCWPGWWDAQRIWSYSSFFHAIILNCFVPLCCWSFLSGLLNSLRDVLFLDRIFVVRMETEISYFTILLT